MEGTLSFSVSSVVEDVLQQHGTHLRDLDLESRKADQAASRRYEAAGWLRKMVGVVAAKDLPAEPSEEEFRLGLRSGIILCNVLNKVQSGTVPKVVESPSDCALITDGAALSAFQYFENVRNFLVAIQAMRVPTFEASDLEQRGKSTRIVSSVLALKSFSEWKQAGGNGMWKFGSSVKPTTSSSVKPFVRKNSEPFTNSLSRNSLLNEKCLSVLSSDVDSDKMSGSSSISVLVRAMLIDKKPEEVTMVVESVLSKVVEEFEHRIAGKYELGNKLLQKSCGDKMDEKNCKATKKDDIMQKSYILNESWKNHAVKHKLIFDQQQNDVQDLKHSLHTTKAGIQFMQMKFQEEFHNLGVHIQSLTHAASGYHRVFEENRKLYNQVQDLKGSIRVYCRVRPFLSEQSNYLSSVDSIEDGNITINTPSKYGKGQKSFIFNRVFGPSATQAEVFSDMQPLIRSVIDGYNVCIFAYGQTGSGKTFTMTGPRELTEKSQGVNYRALGDLFLMADQRKDTFYYDISVQMIEIYNEQVRDLLLSDGSNKRLEIRTTPQNGLSVPDANLIPVSSTFDVMDLMNLGQRNRAVGATALNDRSSRSHSCLTVHVQGRDLTSGSTLRGCMHLVDLAGSERVDKSEVTGDRLKEAQHINKSLSALGDVIASLSQKNSHVPYRNSKLTQLLQDSLGGQAKTLMFVHISPEPDATAETISTLKFAERVATVELGAARVNKDNADVKELKEQITGLKAALARKEGAPKSLERSISGSSEKCRTKASEISTLHSNHHSIIASLHNDSRQPMGDVGYVELPSNSALKKKKTQSFDLDEILANSPPWPPVMYPAKNHGEEMGSGEWVDKVMVNKQDANLGWETEKDHLNNVFYQKYLQNSSKIYPEQVTNVFLASNQFNIGTTDETKDLDAETSDSSEPDSLWQFNHSQITSMANGIGSNTKKLNKKPIKSPELRKILNHSSRPSLLQKLSSGVGPVSRNVKQAAPPDAKRRAGNRK